MNAFAVGGCVVAGILAGIPTVAIAYAVPARGNLRVPERWWLGKPARPVTVSIVSLATGGIAGIVAGRLPWSPALPAFWLLAVLGTGQAVIDLRRHRLPHAITGVIAIGCMLCFATAAILSESLFPLMRAVAAGFVVAVSLLAIAMALPGQLGLGDVSLASAITLSLGWLGLEAAAVGMTGTVVIQAVAVLALKTRAPETGATPLGPSLIAGWLVGVLSATS